MFLTHPKHKINKTTAIGSKCSTEMRKCLCINFFFKQIALLVTLLAILGSRRSYSSHFYKWGIKAQRVCVSSPGLHSM